MADINDFKLLNKISKNYFDTLLNTLQTSAVITEIPNINDLEKSRLGFYLFMIRLCPQFKKEIKSAKIYLNL